MDVSDLPSQCRRWRERYDSLLDERRTYLGRARTSNLGPRSEAERWLDADLLGSDRWLRDHLIRNLSWGAVAFLLLAGWLLGVVDTATLNLQAGYDDMAYWRAWLLISFVLVGFAAWTWRSWAAYRTIVQPSHRTVPTRSAVVSFMVLVNVGAFALVLFACSDDTLLPDPVIPVVEVETP